MLPFLSDHLPFPEKIQGRYFEPFLGGGAVFFHLRPQRALLADLNQELIGLYEGIRKDWRGVWQAYLEMPASRDAYHDIRDWCIADLDPITRAARLLYLNRTCFKGMWRHNSKGKFNVGYGGEARRWVISEETLRDVALCLQSVTLRLSDFEPIIDAATFGDFIFLDPPYRPWGKEMTHDHYVAQQFTFEDHQRLAACLRRSSQRGVRWVMTTSSHPDIASLFSGFTMTPITRGTGAGIGQTVNAPGEILIAHGGL